MFLRRKLRTTIRKNEDLTPKKVKKLKKIEQRDRNSLAMTFSLTLFSFFNLLVQFTCQLVIILFDKVIDNFNTEWFLFIYSFVVALKQFTNIFFLYYFNHNFRKMLLRLIMLRKLNSKREGNTNTGGSNSAN